MREQQSERMGLRDLCKWIRDSIGECGSLIEIGSYLGDSTKIFVEYFKTVTCVDPWSAKEQFRKSMTPGRDQKRWDNVHRKFQQRVGHKVTTMRMTSFEASKIVGTVDVVYIDAVHTYEAVKNDIALWMPHVKHVICGHDYDSVKFQGLIDAVDEEFGEPHATFQDTSWAVRC